MYKIEKLLVASSNIGKIEEIQLSLADYVQEIVPQTTFNIPDADETGTTFVENAIIKARNATRIANMPAIGDDSGIIIDAINGEPGLYSARYAGLDCNFDNNIEKVLQKMHGVEKNKRVARFYCVIVLLESFDAPVPQIFDGTWEGSILENKQGDHGFGYDPIFYVPTHNCSAAELDPDVKNSISHRGLALKKLINYLEK